MTKDPQDFATQEDGETPAEETYHYNADGTLSYKIDRAGRCTNYTYDLLGRCTDEVVWSPTGLILDSKSYTYDGNGNVLNSGGRIRTYDAFGRVLTDTQPGIGTFTYTYDTPVTDNLYDGIYKETMQHDDIGSLDKIYNADGQLVELKLDNESYMCYTYICGKLYCNSSDVTLYNTYVEYNAAGQICDFYTDFAEYHYTFDDQANIVSVLSSAGYSLSNELTQLLNTAKTYTYDNANRLLAETDSAANRTIQYVYDNAGNMLSRTVCTSDTGEVQDTRTYAYDSNNRIGTTETSPYSYVHDANGNLTQENENVSVAYTYDGYNRIKSINKPGLPFLEYEYNQENLRTAKIESDSIPASAKTVYGYDKDGNLVLEKNAYNASDKTVYLWEDTGNAAIMKRGGKAYSYVYDGMGRIHALHDYDAEENTFTYDVYGYTAYGEPLYTVGNVENSFRYASYYYDTDTGLYYLKNRYYAANKARFLTEDPYWNVSNMLFRKFTGSVMREVYYPAIKKRDCEYKQ